MSQTSIEELSLEVQRLIRSLSVGLQEGSVLDSNGNPVEVKVKKSAQSDVTTSISHEGISKDYKAIVDDTLNSILKIEINPDNQATAGQSGLIYHDRISSYIHNTFKPRLKDEVYQLILGDGDTHQGIIDTFKELQKIIGTTEGGNVTESLLSQLTAIRGQADEALRKIADQRLELQNEIANKLSEAVANMAGMSGVVSSKVDSLTSQLSAMTTEYSTAISDLVRKDVTTDQKIDLNYDSLEEMISGVQYTVDGELTTLKNDLKVLTEERNKIGNLQTITRVVDDLKKVKVGDFWRIFTPIV